MKCWKPIIVTVLSLLLCTCSSVGFAADEDLSSKLVIGTKHAPPFAIKRTNGTWDGISIELWRQIADELGLDYELIELNLEELLADLKNRSIDAAVAALTITAEREQVMDFTHPFHTSGLGIALSSRTRAGWLRVMERFVSFGFLKVVVALTIVLFAAGLLVWLFERKRNLEQFGGDAPKGLGAAFWWSAVTMTTVGYGDKAPKTVGGRTVALIWMFTSVIIISSFTAAITSALTVGQLELSIRGPEDLPRVRVATVKSSTSETYLKDHKIPFTAYDNALEALKALSAGGLDAVVYDAPILRYLVSSELNARLTVLPHTFERQYYAIGLVQASELREPINRVLMDKINQPRWQDILHRYLGE